MRRHVPLLTLGILLGAIAVSDAADPKSVGMLEGEVLQVEPDSIIMKKETDGHEVRLRMADFTQRGGEFKPGDKIEAFVTPEGTTTSVQPRVGGFNR
jgi:hypothetical protein